MLRFDSIFNDLRQVVADILLILYTCIYPRFGAILKGVMDGMFVVSFDHYHLTLTFNCKIKVVGIVYASNKSIKTFSFIPMLIQNHYKINRLFND